MNEQYANNYAAALFLICQESNTLAESYEQLKAISDVFAKNIDYTVLMSLPTISKDEKLRMIFEVFNGKVSDIILDFLCVLTENEKLICFIKIFNQFKKLYFEHSGIAEVEVITAMQLNERLTDKLKDKLSKKLNKKIIIKIKIDEKLLGGIVVNFENKQIDLSIRKKLKDIRSSIDSVIAQER